MKNRSHDINRPRPKNRHKSYSKYKMCLIKKMVIDIMQHLSKFWSSIYENIKQLRGWVEKKAFVIKTASNIYGICQKAKLRDTNTSGL